MRIQVKRTGGFAGIPRRAEVDTADRSDAAEWHDLAHRALAEAETTPSPGVPDGFHYTLTVDDTTTHCTDPHLSPSQRELISRVLKEGA
ncbi:protealysin inhibitor emfourin [Streptomyces sp. NPDC050560]|uniref:protealysin inhibitor emfourin n=1 Tax=Streptomyces sp. NPDC050560 TaxID=3365630 RepID=UPI00378E06B4